ncbi:MAG: hypothetical protein IJ011_09540 [Clostridia bacterium]|nr:hypothetical protein [Clostridia bacterium]
MDRDELYEVLNEVLEEKMCELRDDTVSEISEGLGEIVSEALSECLSSLEFRLSDGTLVVPKQRMKLQSPEGDKLIVCYGGLRVDKCKWNGAPEGWALWVQTRISSWDVIAVYPEKSDAVEALKRVKAAMESGAEIFEL